MDETTILLTIAQIAVAFAGFATIASILGRRYSRDHAKVDAFRLRNMLVYSLSVAAFSLYPILPIRLGWPPLRLWPICASFALLWSIPMFIGVMSRIIETRSLRGFNTPIAIINTMLGIGTVVALSLILLPFVVGLPTETLEGFGSAVFAIYLTALLLLLTSCGVSFVLVIYSLLIAENQESGL